MYVKREEDKTDSSSKSFSACCALELLPSRGVLAELRAVRKHDFCLGAGMGRRAKDVRRDEQAKGMNCSVKLDKTVSSFGAGA